MKNPAVNRFLNGMLGSDWTNKDQQILLVMDALARARRGDPDRCVCGWCGQGPYLDVEYRHAVELVETLEQIRNLGVTV